MSKFKIGDVVKLKGATTLITVHSTNGPYVVCRWFDGFDLREKEFNEEELVLEESIKTEKELLQEEESEDKN